MEDSLVDNDEEYLENDSLSSGSISKECLMNGHHEEESHDKPTESVRRGSYTLETSPQMSEIIRNAQLMEPIYVETDNYHQHYSNQKSSDISFKTSRSNKNNMSQSMYDRPWTSGLNSTLSSANNKIREEKIRLAKEEQEKKQKQKIAALNENEKVSQNAKKRKESELLRKIEENKRRAMERQRIVDERKERLNKAEEARRKTILKKLVNNNGKKVSPQSSNGLMTMSCFGGFGNARTKPGNKEVVHNRFINARPLSSTGKVIGFGSSTPRTICENNVKSHGENKKIPEAILLKCEILSRPVSSRMSDKMMTSVISPQIPISVYKRPERQSSFKEKGTSKRVPKSSTMATSMIDFPSKNKPKVHNATTPVLKSDHIIQEELSISVHDSNKSDSKKTVASSKKPSPALSKSSKKNDGSSQNHLTVKAKSGTFPRRMRKTKVDSHLDSDSIEEEVYVKQRPRHLPKPLVTDQESDSLSQKIKVAEKPDKEISTKEESNLQFGQVRAPPTKDLSESDYKARIMENRRIAREKREREREQLMKTEREKRHAEEIAAREVIELERENTISVEETHLVTSNDDTLDGPTEIHEENGEKEEDDENQLSEILETPSVSNNESQQQVNTIEEEKNERKKRLDSIMSRIRKPNDESSSEGGVSPRRAMSPEPAELEPEINNITSAPAFRSALLQSMMNKGGRLSKVPNQNKEEVKENTLETSEKMPESSDVCSVTFQDENLDSQIVDETTPTVVAKFSDIDIPRPDREDCDGKEDSISFNDHIKEEEMPKVNSSMSHNNKVTNSSLSSTETEEEENAKSAFQMDSLYNSSSMKANLQETCVFQN